MNFFKKRSGENKNPMKSKSSSDYKKGLRYPLLRNKTQKVENSIDIQPSLETIISQGSKFNGTIMTSDKMRIQGEFEGKIISQNTVNIDVSGKVKADIFATNILVAGQVIGDINAKERFELHATGSIVGEIKASKISIMDSAQVKGNIEVGTIKEFPSIPEHLPQKNEK
jgi:cytoskeletal protein CcmA (bactofilin family)